MRSLLLATAALFGLAHAAYAGEGNGEPFPGPDASVTTNVGTPVYAHKDQDPFQYRVTGPATSMGGYKPLANKSQDPYPFRVPDQVVTLHAPVTGPVSGTATTSNGQGGARPMAEHPVAGRGGHS